MTNKSVLESSSMHAKIHDSNCKFTKLISILM